MEAVLFATRWADPLTTMTGIGRYMVELTRSIAAIGEREGWTFNVSGPREALRPDWLPDGVGYRPVRVPRVPIRLAWAMFGRPKIESLIGPFDLVHALHSSTQMPTCHPAVVTVHDLIPVEHPEWFGPGVGWAARRAIRNLGRGSGLVIAVSAHTAGLIEGHGVERERISVIHEAVGDDFRRAVDIGEMRSVCASYDVEPGQYFMSVGNLSTRKNLGTVVRAMSALKHLGLSLLLCGKPFGEESALNEEIDRLGVRNLVTLAGFVPDRDLPPLLAGAVALLQPSVDEGFGLPLLEAMAVGTPVVASDAGSHPEIAGDAALLVPPQDVEAWATTISKVTSDDRLRAQLVDAGKLRATQFTWDRTARQTLEVYRSALR